jgi:hypothetical protein
MKEQIIKRLHIAFLFVLVHAWVLMIFFGAARRKEETGEQNEQCGESIRLVPGAFTSRRLSWSARRTVYLLARTVHSIESKGRSPLFERELARAAG